MKSVSIILHNKGKLWEVAMSLLIESGDNSVVLAETIVMVGKSGAVLLSGYE